MKAKRNRHTFKKGHIPKNKGKRQTDYMSDEAIERTKATRFKKGQRPPNYRPVGSERFDKDGYIMLKVREGLRGWQLKHRVVWEETYGAIPRGYNIQFKDGNRENCKIENLYIITRIDAINGNTIHRYSPEIKTAIRRVNKLTKIINDNE